MKQMLGHIAAQVEEESRKQFVRMLAALESINGLRAVQAIVQDTDRLSSRMEGLFLDMIDHEIGLREKLETDFPQVDRALGKYPHVARRVKGIGYKAGLLEFSQFCSCDVEFACGVLEQVVQALDAGEDTVEHRCGRHIEGVWPKNHYPSVFAAVAMLGYHPCFRIRALFLEEVGFSGMRNFEIAVFNRKQLQAVPA